MGYFEDKFRDATIGNESASVELAPRETVERIASCGGTQRHRQPLTESAAEAREDRRQGSYILPYGAKESSMTAAVLIDVLEAANRHGEKPLSVRVAALKAAYQIARADLEAEREFETDRLEADLNEEAEDPWTGAVLGYADVCGDSVRIIDVLRGTFNLCSVRELEHRDVLRVAAILRAAGWQRRRVIMEDGQQLRYFKPEALHA